MGRERNLMLFWVIYSILLLLTTISIVKIRIAWAKAWKIIAAHWTDLAAKVFHCSSFLLHKQHPCLFFPLVAFSLYAKLRLFLIFLQPMCLPRHGWLIQLFDSPSHSISNCAQGCMWANFYTHYIYKYIYTHIYPYWYIYVYITITFYISTGYINSITRCKVQFSSLSVSWWFA